MKILDPQEVLRTSVLEFRGDGKAGGGLVLCFQSIAGLMLSDPEMHVQEWPFFSSARRGAAIRSFVRGSRKPIAKACEVTRPHVSLLMDEAASRSVDFAQGVLPGGTFVINTPHTPAECAKHFRLSGRVFTIAGDDIGLKYLKYPIGNVSAYVAVAQAIGGFAPQQVVTSFLAMLKKRRIPDPLLKRNQQALEASFEAVRSGEFDEARPGDHAPVAFAGYGDVPVGAQTALRLSQTNLTAAYARSGVQLKFDDPEEACTGCSHCVTNCPEGIIFWRPDEKKGMVVTGVDVGHYCKLCGECIAVCPEHLFKEVEHVQEWEEVGSK